MKKIKNFLDITSKLVLLMVLILITIHINQLHNKVEKMEAKIQLLEELK